jgi:dTDP-4-dehydrorhamnose reductase
VKVLVLGANGQVGRATVEEAARRGHACVALRREEADLGAPATLARALDAIGPVDVVVNAAAYTKVDQAESDRDRCFAVNRDGPAALADWCATRDAALVHFSTDYVFDGSKTEPYAESDATRPLSVYGASKEAGERAIRRRWHRHVILRTSWVYDAAGANFVRTMLRLGLERDVLKVVADQRGAPTTAADLAATALHVAERVLSAKTSFVLPAYGTYHCTAEGETTWRDFADAIFEIAGRRVARRPTIVGIPTSDYPTPAARPKYSVLDNARLTAAFAPPRRPWRDGLVETLDRLFAAPAPKGVS